MDTLTIAGRKWKAPTVTTAENDNWNQKLIHLAGLGQLAKYPHEDADAFALRVYRTASANSDVFRLLGGMLIPEECEPEAWAPELAEETAAIFRKCTAQPDKAIIEGHLVMLIMGFLRAGLIFIVDSPKSSESVKEGKPVSRSWTAEEIDSEFGPTSSAK